MAEHSAYIRTVGGSTPSAPTIRGGWRSWLARIVDIDEVIGSNPIPPTKKQRPDWGSCFFKFALPFCQNPVILWLSGGYSSVGRASHLQCGGRRFESGYLHQNLFTAEFASLGASPLASAGISAR